MKHQPEKNPLSDPSSDIRWQAFCYVAGELADQPRQQFEALLLHDQTAREAVADAVLQAGLMDAAFQLNAIDDRALAVAFADDKTIALSDESVDRNLLRQANWRPIALAVIAGCLLIAAITFWSLNQDAGTTPAVAGRSVGDAAAREPQPDQYIDLAEEWADSDWELDTQSITDPVAGVEYLPEDSTAEWDWLSTFE